MDGCLDLLSLNAIYGTVKAIRYLQQFILTIWVILIFDDIFMIFQFLCHLKQVVYVFPFRFCLVVPVEAVVVTDWALANRMPVLFWNVQFFGQPYQINVWCSLYMYSVAI